MSEPIKTSGSPQDAKQHTRHMLELLRGARAGGSIPQSEASSPSTPTSRSRPPSPPPQEDTSWNTDLPPAQPHKTPFTSVGKHLQRKKSGRLGKIMSHTRQLAEFNTLFLAYLPPNFRDHATLAQMDSESWVVQTDSSAWATRLRYSLPNIRQQLGQQVGIKLPAPKIRIVPPDADLPEQPPPRRISVTDEMVNALESAARDLNDPRLGAAMMRLADHARRRQTEV